jgi:hypothetical protein
MHGNDDKCMQILIGKPDWNRPLGRPRHRLKDNIKLDLKEGCESVDWINLAQDTIQWQALLNPVLNLQVP